MKQKTIGVIGGLGPETGHNFCLSLNNRIKPITRKQPHILLDNLPISLEAEANLINGGASQEHLNLLIESVERLNKLNSDFIAITCNTVHVFIKKLRRASNTNILSITEETAKRCNELKLTKVGILGSTKTTKSKLHARELKRFNIEAIIPNQLDQIIISKCIQRIINNQTKETDKASILEIINKLKKKGAEAIILGCTELPILISKKEVNIQLINTLEILENSSVRKLLEST